MAGSRITNALGLRIAAHLTAIEHGVREFPAWPAPPPMLGDESDPLTPAAVLVPIVDHPGEPTVLLTIRTDRLQHHPGQISFPGGRAEMDDADPVATALRESEEELGLDREKVEILGYLDAHRTVTGFFISPVVGLLPPGVALNPDPLEVAEAFEVPLKFLLDPANCSKKEVEYEGRARSYFVYHYGERVIWGATARIVVNMCLKLRSETEAGRISAASRKNCELE